MSDSTTFEPREERRPDASRNLAPQRGPSVWDRPEPTATWSAAESERWCIAACGSALLAMGLRQRGSGGRFLALAGGTLAVRALLGFNDLAMLRGAITRLRGADGLEDAIDSAADESFPASDATAFTATSGTVVKTP